MFRQAFTCMRGGYHVGCLVVGRDLRTPTPPRMPSLGENGDSSITHSCNSIFLCMLLLLLPVLEARIIDTNVPQASVSQASCVLISVSVTDASTECVCIYHYSCSVAHQHVCCIIIRRKPHAHAHTQHPTIACRLFVLTVRSYVRIGMRSTVPGKHVHV